MYAFSNVLVGDFAPRLWLVCSSCVCVCLCEPSIGIELHKL